MAQRIDDVQEQNSREGCYYAVGERDVEEFIFAAWLAFYIRPRTNIWPCTWSALKQLMREWLTGEFRRQIGDALLGF